MRAGRFVESRAAAAVAGGVVVAVLSGGAAIAQAKITGADIVNGSIARADLKPSVVQDIDAPAAGASVRYVERQVDWVEGQLWYEAACPAGTKVLNSYVTPYSDRVGEATAVRDDRTVYVDPAKNAVVFVMSPVTDHDQAVPDAGITVQLVCLETS